MNETSQSAVGRRTIEVGWGDCDPAGIVFFPRYFEWFEMCTAAFFAGVGLPLHKMFMSYGLVGIPLVDVGARFFLSSSYGDKVDVETCIAEWRTRSFRLEHRFSRDGKRAVEGHEVRVWALPDRSGARPMRAGEIPAEIKARFGPIGNDAVR